MSYRLDSPVGYAPLDDWDHEMLIIYEDPEGINGPTYRANLRDDVLGGHGLTPQEAIRNFATRLRTLADRLDSVAEDGAWRKR